MILMGSRFFRYSLGRKKHFLPTLKHGRIGWLNFGIAPSLQKKWDANAWECGLMENSRAKPSIRRWNGWRAPFGKRQKSPQTPGLWLRSKLSLPLFLIPKSIITEF